MMDRERSIDKKSLEERKKRNCTELQSEAKNEQLQGLYFDVIKDETLVINKLRLKFFRGTKKEEHYSHIQEPGSVYIGHVLPSLGCASDIADSIISFCLYLGFPLT